MELSIPPSVDKHQLDYHTWLLKGREITEQHGTVQWNIGDWVLDGQCAFDYKDLVGNLGYVALNKVTEADGTTGYRAPIIPSFWKDVSSETNLAISTLKNLSHVARAYTPETRFKELSW